ncbi:MAG TPA: ABC transporter ATP-binding protein [Firmicutes bacterium]|nr:ABC transporter ATP-binding protein [Bacillota bacterium]
MLRLTDVAAAYGSIKALHGVSLEVQPGEVVCLIGSNGAGKTTTLMSIMGVVRPTAGEIAFAGRRLNGLSTPRIVSLGISCVPEGRHIFPKLSVEENLEMGAYTQRRNKAQTAEKMAWVYELFPILRERRHQAGGTLSGGQQQMLAVGRGLMANPRLLLLDEPSLGLAPLLVEQVLGAVAKIKKEGVTVLLVEQNALAALEISDRGYVLENGRIVLMDQASALSANESVQRTYLGKE